MKSIDLELGHSASPTSNGNDRPQHVKIVDPVPSNNRRAKWLNEKIMAKRINGDHDYERILERNGSLKMKKEKDSGYQEGSLGRNPSFYTKTSCSNDDVTISHGKSNGFSSSERWRPRPSNDDHRKAQLRNTCSLNCNFNHYMEDVFLPMQSTQTFDDADDDDPDLSDGHFGLSRQNGIRHSLKHHLHTQESPTESVCSISSESAESQLHGRIGSQGDFEPPDEEKRSGSRYGKDKWKRHSIFFNSSESWTEEGLANLTREMTPSSASIFECAVTGDILRLTELLPENLEDSTRLLRSLHDSAGRTPLHLAAACGHAAAVQLLIEKGADLEVCDKHHKATPLMCAAGCPSLPAVQVLLDNGANVNAGFRETGKTALLWATQAESAECLQALLQHGALQNPPIAYSETALHIAAALGNLQCVELLVDHGADVTLKKGNSRSTALHLAAEEANIPCIRRLLQAGAPLSAQDAKGQTPLHIAACSDTDVTSLLLAAGAQPHTVDDNGRTPLHCAVARGSRAAECVRLLLEAGAEVNAQDSFGYTPLHLAGVNESSQCASILLHHGADVTAKTKAGTTVLSVLVRKIPDVVRYLVERLDSAVTIHDHDPGDPDCEIRLDFRAIVPNSEKRVPGKTPKQEQIFYHVPRKETEFLTCLLAAGNKKILAHPLSEAFLHLKWKRVRKFFWASLGFQIALVLLYTIYVMNTYLIKCPYDKTLQTITDNEDWETAATTVAPPPSFTAFAASDEENRFNLMRSRTKRSSFGFSWFNLDPERSVSSKASTASTTTTTTQKPALPGGPRTRFIGADIPLPDVPADDAPPEEKGCHLGMNLTVVWFCLMACTLVLAIKELFQLAQSPLAYILSSENWGQWALIGAVSVTAWPASSRGLYLSHWQYPAAAFGIFLAYSLMLLQVGRQPALGLYVQMLGKVAANFGLFILAYSCLLIAFALAFSVIYPGNPAYSSPQLALIKVLTMMVGEVDYETQFYGEDRDTVPYPIAAHVLHCAFVVFISIILMNLLVGLAVHDIQGLQKGAKLNRLSRQTTLICRLESFIFSKRLQACLPKSIGLWLQKKALLVPSSYSWSYYFRPNDPRDKRIPKELKKAALRLAAARHAAKHGARMHAMEASKHGSHLGGPDMQLRRIDQRIDRLQKQLDTALQNISDNIQKLVRSDQRTCQNQNCRSQN